MRFDLENWPNSVSERGYRDLRTSISMTQLKPLKQTSHGLSGLCRVSSRGLWDPLEGWGWLVPDRLETKPVIRNSRADLGPEK